jgi:hypothetical protein
MRNALFALFFAALCVCASVSAATIATDQPAYDNNAHIRISGTSDSEQVTVTGRLGDLAVFTKTIATQGGAFSFDYPISYTDPVGHWTIGTEGATPVGVDVNPTNDSATLVLAFTSPASGHYTRTQTIQIGITLTKNSQPVTAALVTIWDTAGQRATLTEKGNGAYLLDYRIPPDARTGPWTLYATAQGTVDDQRFGGQASHVLEIDPTGLELRPVSPIFPQYNAGETLDITLAPAYPDQTLPAHVAFDATLDGKPLLFAKTAEGTYRATHPLDAQSGPALALDIRVTDDYNNTGRLLRTVALLGQNDYFLRAYGIAAIVGAILFLTALHFFLSRHKKANRLAGLAAKEQELAQSEKTLQEKYFKQQSIDESAYERESALLSRKKLALEEKRRSLEEKK